MKKLISGLAIASILFLTSCGGGAEKQLIGTWKVDASSIDMQLGEEFPADMKAMVEGGKAEMKEEMNGEMDGLSIEFQEGGKFVMAMEGESEKIEGTWKVEGDKLVIDAEVEGKKGTISLNLDEVTADKVALSLSAEDLLAEIKKQMPEAIEEIPAQMDIDAMAKGTKFMASLKK